MKGIKNDFSIVFYNVSKRVLYLKYVHNTYNAVKWVKEKNIVFTFYRVYNRRNETFIGDYLADDINALNPFDFRDYNQFRKHQAK